LTTTTKAPSNTLAVPETTNGLLTVSPDFGLEIVIAGSVTPLVGDAAGGFGVAETASLVGVNRGNDTFAVGVSTDCEATTSQPVTNIRIDSSRHTLDLKPLPSRLAGVAIGPRRRTLVQ
jgi:hypothetical protein